MKLKQINGKEKEGSLWLDSRYLNMEDERSTNALDHGAVDRATEAHRSIIATLHMILPFQESTIDLTDPALRGCSNINNNEAHIEVMVRVSTTTDSASLQAYGYGIHGVHSTGSDNINAIDPEVRNIILLILFIYKLEYGLVVLVRVLYGSGSTFHAKEGANIPRSVNSLIDHMLSRSNRLPKVHIWGQTSIGTISYSNLQPPKEKEGRKGKMNNEDLALWNRMS